MPQDSYGQLAKIMEPINRGGKFDWLPGAFMSAVTGAVAGGMLPGIDAMTGAAMPAGQTSVLSGLKSFLPGSESWGVNPKVTGPYADMYRDFAGSGGASGAGSSLYGDIYQQFNPPTGMSMPDWSGELKGAATGAVPTSTGMGFSSPASGLSGLLTPKNLLNAGGAIGSAVLGNSAINKAVDAQTGAADRATAATLSMYNQNRDDLAPWRDAGSQAVTRLSSMLTPGNQATALQMDPGYQFRMDEGQRALERSAAARGNLFSGDTGKALTRYGQNFGTNEFTNATNRLSNLAGLGQTATNTTAALGANATNQTNANTIGAGNARASGYIGGANAITGSLSNFLRGMQEEDMLKAILGGR
jgi:hypothetical protein